MKLGRVEFAVSYVVDIDNLDMVEEAMSCVFEDVCNAVKYDEISSWITTAEPRPDDTESDIPEFLLAREDDEEITKC